MRRCAGRASLVAHPYPCIKLVRLASRCILPLRVQRCHARAGWHCCAQAARSGDWLGRRFEEALLKPRLRGCNGRRPRLLLQRRRMVGPHVLLKVELPTCVSCIAPGRLCAARLGTVSLAIRETLDAHCDCVRRVQGVLGEEARDHHLNHVGVHGLATAVLELFVPCLLSTNGRNDRRWTSSSTANGRHATG